MRRSEVVWNGAKLVKPSEAALPDFVAKLRKQLGTRTADAEELAARALCRSRADAILGFSSTSCRHRVALAAARPTAASMCRSASPSLS